MSDCLLKTYVNALIDAYWTWVLEFCDCLSQEDVSKYFPPWGEFSSMCMDDPAYGGPKSVVRALYDQIEYLRGKYNGPPCQIVEDPNYPNPGPPPSCGFSESWFIAALNWINGLACW